MPTPAKGPRMGGSPAHERLMLSNLAAALFEHGRITTTESKAKRLRPYAEHLITFGKRGDLHARRQVLKRIRDKSVVHTLFAEIGPRYAARPGGYTRIVKLGPRKGDNAPMALIELVEALTVAQTAVGEAERARGSRVAPTRPVTGATREAAQDLAAESPTAAGVAADAGTVEPGPDAVVTPDASADEVGPTTTAAGATDAGATDAGATDAGATDAGATDAGATDAGATDADATDADATGEAPSDEATPGGSATVTPAEAAEDEVVGAQGEDEAPAT